MALICSSFFHFLPVTAKCHKSKYAFRVLKTEMVSQVNISDAVTSEGWSFRGGSKLNSIPRFKRTYVPCHAVRAVDKLSNSTKCFYLGTAAVLPFYTLMVLAPRAEMTRKSMACCLPYIAFGVVYAYLLYLSWTPGTLRAMFADKYWMPELNAVASLFTNEMSLSSAWIHLLAIDLFAARQVYHEGLANNIETRHSVSLCLLFCPIGLLSHFITRILTERARRGESLGY